ncbi:hypothetical protein BsWGS_02576 [Bradybaena similaris]
MVSINAPSAADIAMFQLRMLFMCKHPLDANILYNVIFKQTCAHMISLLVSLLFLACIFLSDCVVLPFHFSPTVFHDSTFEVTHRLWIRTRDILLPVNDVLLQESTFLSKSSLPMPLERGGGNKYRMVLMES